MIIDSSKISNLKIATDTGFISQFAVASLKKNKDLISLINKIIQTIPKNKKKTIFNKWISHTPEINREYIIVGGVTPGVKLYAGDFSFNYNYSPRFEYENIVAEGFHYFSLSYRFY